MASDREMRTAPKTVARNGPQRKGVMTVVLAGTSGSRRSLAGLQRLHQLLRVLFVSLQKRSCTFERRLQFRVLGIRDQGSGCSVDHGLVVGDFVGGVLLVEGFALKRLQLLFFVCCLL